MYPLYYGETCLLTIISQALAGLTLGKSTDYRDTYDASLLQGVPRSLNRDPLGLACR